MKLVSQVCSVEQTVIALVLVLYSVPVHLQVLGYSWNSVDLENAWNSSFVLKLLA